MSWQVEQLKEELNAKEAQGEELKKRVAGLQTEVSAVRLISLCAVAAHLGSADSVAFWAAYTLLTLHSAILKGAQTNWCYSALFLSSVHIWLVYVPSQPITRSEHPVLVIYFKGPVWKLTLFFPSSKKKKIICY